MGKGGGSGRGKGGCEGFAEGATAMICCLLCVLLLGPIFIAAGIGCFVGAGKDSRQKSIDRVLSAANTWESSTTDGYSAIMGTSLDAYISHGGLCTGNAGSVIQAKLTPTNATQDYYEDATSQLQNKKQARLRTTFRAPSSAMCPVQVVITNPAAGNATVASFSRDMQVAMQVDVTQGSRDCSGSISGCSTKEASACRANCEDGGGVWSCSGSGYYTCPITTYFNDLCVKMIRLSDGTWTADGSKPSGGTGCNVPVYYGAKIGTSQSSQMFQVPNATRSWRTMPASLTLTVRSSSDPWLAYMWETNGTGDFGITKKALIILGVVLLIIGCVLTVCWCVAGWYLYKARSGRMQQRPDGFIDGRFYDVYYRWGWVQGAPAYAPAQGGYQMTAYPTGAVAYPPPPPGGYQAYPPAPGAYPVAPPVYGATPPAGWGSPATAGAVPYGASGAYPGPSGAAYPGEPVTGYPVYHDPSGAPGPSSYGQPPAGYPKN